MFLKNNIVLFKQFFCFGDDIFYRQTVIFFKFAQFTDYADFILDSDVLHGSGQFLGQYFAYCAVQTAELVMVFYR